MYVKAQGVALSVQDGGVRLRVRVQGFDAYTRTYRVEGFEVILSYTCIGLF